MSVAADRLAGLSPEKRALLARRLAEKAAPPPAAPQLERIAIVAAACRLPGGVASPDELWQLLVQGRDAVSAVPPERWDGEALFDANPTQPQRINSRRGGFLDGVADFDAAFFGISPREAALMDPQQRLLLEVAWEALESAGLVVDRLAGSASGVFIGAHSHSNDYQLLQLAQPGGVESHSSTGSAHSILANRLSYVFDWRGPSMAVDTACSSSLVAVHLACQSLRSGECDLALAGGVNLMLLPPASLMFSKLQILSSDGCCRSFDAAANGIARAEGCGLVVLKRLSDAVRDGDPVLATIAGSAVNQDGASNGLTAPSGAAQQAVIRRALALAGIAPQRVGLVETHGTGTPMGDPVEVEALAHVIGPAQGADHRCWLGAVKTNLGHLEAAAGIAGLIKAVWCLRQGQVPANLHFSRLNPHIQLAGTPFVIPTALVDWPSPQALRVAGVSSFGFGGTNAHVVLEEHVAATLPVQGPASAVQVELYTVSAKSPTALTQAVRDHAAALRDLPDTLLADVVHTATARRSHHGHRVAVVGATAAALSERLEARLAAGLPPAGHDAAGQTVFVYTGQGSQWAGMGRELFDTEPVFRARLLDVTTAFQQQAGWDLLAAINEPSSAAMLASTEVAQPAIFAMQVALTAWWRSQGLQPGAVVGHSVGEIAAAHTAGVLSLDDAVRVVLHRSRAMQPALGQGRMAQVECAPQDLRDELARFGDMLSIAALNGPTSTVLSGQTEALARCVEQLQARGIATRALGVDYAFHSAQMDRFVPSIAQFLHALKPQPATLPLMSTVSGRWCEAGDFDAAYWGRNVRETVRFAPAMTQLMASGFRLFLEVGPHPALGTGMHDVAAAQGVPVTLAASLRRAQPARAALLGGLGTLYEGGATIDWPARAETPRRVVALPAYPWQRQRHWLVAPDVAALAFSVTGRVGPFAGDEDSTGCYQMGWRAAPTVHAAPAPLAIDLDALVEPLAGWAACQPPSVVLAQESAALFVIEQRATMHAWRALADLGIAARAGERIAMGAEAALGVQPRHARLWQRLLQMLESSGHLQRSGDGWVVTPFGEGWRDADAPAPPPRVEAALLDRCGAQLAAVLRGRADPLTLLFPPDGQDSAAAIYTATASARTYNQLAAEAVASVVRSSGGRPLRMLEIGAGTGATTAVLMPMLPAGSSYCYTDVSPGFLRDAETRLHGSAVAFTFRRLDIEQPPETQGFASAGFDIVVASNVLHATVNLRRTLQHVRALLAPGGLLVLIETVARRAWLDLSFGLTDGWWRFDDPQDRSVDALASPARWTALLAEAGFDVARAVGEALSRDSLHAQALLLARVAAPVAPAALRFAGTAWRVVGDRGGFGARLADAIRAEGGDCAWVDSLACAEAPPGPPRNIVHCGALDAPTAGQTELAGLDAAIAGGVASALAWAQWLAGSASNAGARLWLITRGAQRVDAADRAIAPAQALQWGLGRSLALETPQAWGGLIDLNPKASVDAAVASLLDELFAPAVDDQVALRTSGRHVARLSRQPRPRGRRLDLNSGGAYLVTGGLGGLGPKIARWLADQGARRVVLLGRSGLPDASATDAIEVLRAQGTEVIVERADVADRDAMGRLFARLRDAGTPIRGVVHAAAAIGFQPLAHLTAAELSAALRAKVQGSWVLHELTRETELDLFVMFSSGTAVFGAKGLAAYATANQFLGALAWHRASLGLPATCVDWGAWSEIRLLGAAAHNGVEQLGFRTMSDAVAFDILSGLVHDRVPQCMVADLDWTVACAAYQAHGPRAFLEDFTRNALAPAVALEAVAATSEPDLRTTLGLVPPRERRDRVAGVVREELARVLGLPGAQSVDTAQGFFELGLDSLMAMQLRRRLTGRVGVDLPATITFNYPSVAALTDHLLGLVAPSVAPDALPEPAVHDDALEALSDAQVRSLLMAELEGWSDTPALHGDAGS